MQFLWKYIDDLVGKGLEWYILGELLLYMMATFVPLALPLAMLLSSIMTFGTFGENYELVATKSAGISLIRLMKPLIVVSALVCVGAFYFANNIIPIANLKAGALLYDVRQQRPALAIREGIFYNGIEGYSIRIGEKDEEGKVLKDIMIYDHSQGLGNNKVILAESGSMVMSHDERYLILTLENGRSYEEQLKPRGTDPGKPHIRTMFLKQEIRFDLSAFKLERTNEDLFKDHQQMLNLKQLKQSTDTLQERLDKRISDYKSNVNTYFQYKPDKVNAEAKAADTAYFFNTLPPNEKTVIIESALNIARSLKSYISATNDDVEYRKNVIRRHEIEFHRKFTLSFAILVLFFVGAPLGAIIRKGGLGMPVVVSMFFFILFHVMSITGEKFAREGVLSPAEGMWASALILLPVGIFLTHKANTDAGLMEKESYARLKRRITRFFKSRKKEKSN
jgi:lipopolysaccharide export system permease protein